MSDRKRPKPADYFSDWKAREALAESMIPLVGELYRRFNVKTYIYGRNLVSQSVLDIMKTHRFVRQVEKNELAEWETAPFIKALAGLHLGPAHVDIGRIAVNYELDGVPRGLNREQYLAEQLEGLIDATDQPVQRPRDVVLYGFGRIGRLMARLLIEKTGGGEVLRVRAFVVRKGGKQDLAKRAALLRRDSVHGPFKGTIRVDEDTDSIIANGNPIKVLYAESPDQVDYAAHGIENAVVIDNTGIWRDAESLGAHLKSPGVAAVLLTAPGKGDVPNIVYGVNEDLIKPADSIVSAASCTTNAIVPALKLVNDQFGVVSGHVETVHAYTNDQNLIDNYHKKNRRGRSAALNMVLTETGAANAVAKILPELGGKLTGNAIRVPVPNVSMAILHLRLGRDSSVDELNEYMRWASLHSPLRKQIDYTASPEVVSCDFIGSRAACVFDAEATIVNGANAILYLWYDNEFGYACQVHRVLERMAGVRYAVYPLEDPIDWCWPAVATVTACTAKS